MEKKQDSALKVVISYFANRFRNLFTRDEMHDIACGLEVLKRERILEFQLFEGLHRFLPTLFLYRGFRVTEIPVKHHPRHFGSSKYRSRLSTILDLIVVAGMQRRRLSYRVREDSEGRQDER